MIIEILKKQYQFVLILLSSLYSKREENQVVKKSIRISLSVWDQVYAPLENAGGLIMLRENGRGDDKMKCEKCGAILSGDDSYEHAGQALCEDCYLDIKAAPKACDPWAVFTAKKEARTNPSLTPVQQQIMDLIRDKGSLTAEEICKALNISETEFRVNFTTLRHMELARASKQGDTICYTTFGA